MNRTKTIKLKPQVRSLRYDPKQTKTRTLEDGTEVIRIAISSEYPAPRYIDGETGLEVLLHTPEAVDLSRLHNAHPFLLDHDTQQFLGRLDNVSLDEDKVLRADVVFTDTPLALQTKKEMLKGLRQHISVGYEILHINRKVVNGEVVFEVDAWLPFEASSVLIPADPTVGVGRTKHNLAALTIRSEYQEEREVTINYEDEGEEEAVKAVKEQETPAEEAEKAADEAVEEEETPTETEEKAEETVTEEDEVVAEKAEETSEEAETADTEAEDVEEKAENEENKDEQIVNTEEADETSEDERTATPVARVQDNLSPKAERSGLSLPDAAMETERMSNEIVTVDLSNKEKKQYSVARGLYGVLTGKRDGLEHEVSQFLARKLNTQNENSFMVPTSIMGYQRALNSGLNGISGDGSEFVFEQGGEFIDVLRAQTVLGKVGAQFKTLSAPLTLPYATSDVPVTWIDENGDAATAQTGSFGQIAFGMRSAVVNYPLTRQLTLASVYDVESLVVGQIQAAIANKIEYVAFQGTAANKQPVGLATYSGVGSVVTSGSYDATFAKLVELETVVSEANAAGNAYVTTPGMRGYLKTKVRHATAATNFVWEGDEVNGYKAYATSNVPKTLDAGAGHAIFFGDWTNLIVADYGAIEFTRDETSGAAAQKIFLVAAWHGDVKLARADAFARIIDARVS